MSLSNMMKILDQHSIHYKVIDERIIADNSYTLNGITHDDSIDLTDFSKKQLYYWLGY